MDTDGGSVDDGAHDPRATGWRRLRRPGGLVAQTRWLFSLMAVASVLLSAPGLVGVPSTGLRWAAAATFLALIAVWTYRYLALKAPFWLDVVEAVLMLVAAVCGPEPVSVFGYLFASLWLRALYGSTWAVLAHTALMALAVLGGLAVSAPLLVRDDPPSQASITGVVTTVPVMFLTVAVARYLVLSLFSREQSQERGTALVRLGNTLIGLTDDAEIRRRGTECAHALCAATPGLRLLLVRVVDGEAVVVSDAGDVREVPRTLPASMLRDTGPDERPVADTAALAGIAGPDAGWVVLPLADPPGGWILAGAVPQVPVEARVAIRSMANQVSLALRTSEAHHDLATQATQDPVTGLANRAAFTAALGSRLADPVGRTALLFLDLDDFKRVNDDLGHSAGDELLRRVAARLRGGIRHGDLCARIGGDEFAVLLDAADPDGAVGVGERLVEVVAAPFPLHGRLARIGASAGLAFAEPSPADRDGDLLVHRADVAMYAAKATGKNRLQVFDPSLLGDGEDARFEDELARAAAADQLVVHHQPIVRVDDGWCVAVEALVRWQHPVRGLLHPADFVAVAERTGAIVDIGAWVLRRACADAVGWAGAAGPLAVHVNVSAVQLTTPGFVRTVQSCVADAALPPCRLVLEVTEGMVLDTPAVHRTLAELAATGVQLAIDDFGTGYSALSTLRSLPLDIVKIDKSFLGGGRSRAANEALVEAIVQVATRLDLQVVAEGVERPEQLAFLRGIGAHATQGYLHARPAPPAAFADWLRRWEGEVRAPALTRAVPDRSAPPAG
ncbi:putative bifunctional diguanylate cyclase/phosphodiesterase [Pseudonocardia lacus]|uniref:putative bifunctional diguanylate cyclase/phosphodiesterase n=1 Tax=Pseudonocardia lacus TaxID=2835865 RepID=UPI001BDDBD82|nr:EAL domain-containing protein [Pseudonocardia lacus]